MEGKEKKKRRRAEENGKGEGVENEESGNEVGENEKSPGLAFSPGLL